MPNLHRGEIEIILAGRSFTMRPTFQALCEIEGETGQGVLSLARKFESGELTLREMAAIVFYTVRAHDPVNHPEFKAIGESLSHQGFQKALVPITQFFVGILNGYDG